MGLKRLPTPFSAPEYVQDALGVMRGGRRLEVELVFTKKAAAWVKDQQWHPSQQMASMKDGRMKMKLKVADNEELLGWILSFGGQVKVLGPDELGNKVEAEAKRIVRNSGQRSGGRRHNHEPHLAAQI